MKQRQTSLDLLRLLAAVLVMWIHCGRQFGLSRAETEIGVWGLQLFFVLSGYLAAASLARDARPLPYYRRRALRILPAYWLLLAVRWLTDLVYYARQMPLTAVLTGPCGPRYLRYFFFLQMILPSDNWALWNNRGGLWSMSVFAVFYLLAPWLYRLLRGFWPTLAAAALLLAVKGRLGAALEAALSPHFPTEGFVTWYCAQTPLMVLHCFLLGMAVWHAVREGKALWLAGFCAALLLAFRGQRGAGECVCTLLMLAAVCLPQPRLPQKLLPLVKDLSGASFCIYLMHPLLLEFFPTPALHGAALRGYTLVCMVLIGAASCAVYSLAIRPLERWAGRKFAH